MPNCESIDRLVTPYVDGQLADADRRTVDEHLRACAPCHSRVRSERAIRDLIHTRRHALTSACAPDSVYERCARAALPDAPTHSPMKSSEVHTIPPVPPSLTRARELQRDERPRAWRARVAPFAAAASLVLIVGTAFLYQLTASSNRVMAAELAADHLKCFKLNGMLRTHDDPATVESSMLSGFGWRMRLPEQASNAGLELVGSRPCLYGEGKIAHIMYRHNGEPVSLFMLPRTARTEEFVQVMGHNAAIWCANDRTFVLVAHEPKAEVERIATVVQAALR